MDYTLPKNSEREGSPSLDAHAAAKLNELEGQALRRGLSETARIGAIEVRPIEAELREEGRY